MLMRGKTVLWVAVLLLGGWALFGGDIASFINLGFSENSRYYMFGQYGVHEESSFPYADIFVVDVPKNDFVTGGVKHGEYSIPNEPGSRGEGALLNLLEDHLALKRQYEINHVQSGRLLYVRVDGQKPKANLDFRDFVTGTRYLVTMDQKKYGAGGSVSSSFHIDLTVIPSSDSARDYRIGLPQYRRTGVSGYTISRVILSPSGRSLVFLIEKEQTNKSGSDIRFMVETVTIGG